jgi:ATP-dependent RNA helicase DDX46/PRP5
MTPTR